MMRSSTIPLLLVLGQQLFQTSHGFAPRPIVMNNMMVLHQQHTTRRPMTLAVSSDHHHDARQQSVDNHHETPTTTTTIGGGGVWVKDCRTAIAGLAVGCLLVFSPVADSQAATPGIEEKRYV
jgi:hypothetical protein